MTSETPPIGEVPPGWEVEDGDFGGRLVRHLHGDVSATAYLYSNPDEVWASASGNGDPVSFCGLDPTRPPGLWQ